MRQFTLKHDDNLVRLQYGSEAEFDFNRSGSTYSENGKVLRVYHRVSNQYSRNGFDRYAVDGGSSLAQLRGFEPGPKNLRLPSA
jgi:hypothetical protein